MNRDRSDRSRLMTWISAATPWTATLLMAASIDRLWLLLPKDSPLAFSLVTAPLAVMLGLGILVRQSRARAQRRDAALDAYAEREIARASSRTGQLYRNRRLARTAAGNKP